MLLFTFAISFVCAILCLVGRVGYLIRIIRRKRALFSWPLAEETDNHHDEDDNNKKQPTKNTSPQEKQQPLKTLVVLGSGGHTSEMIQLIRNLPKERYHPLVFVKAATDTTSIGRLQAANLLSEESAVATTVVCDIPRAREVGQSYISSVYSTLYAVWYAIRLVARLRPDLLLCNGPGTCLPLCLAAFGWRIVNWTKTRIIFVESYCRVQTMSLTGRLLYAWVDLFAVHWPTLQTKYPLTQCTSTMIRHEEKKKQ